ncbi:MAG: DUF2877 domain-containing protein [Anaerolineae bacterium]
MSGPGRVLAVFERAWILLPVRGEPFSLVLPTVGDGPLNVVVAAPTGCFGHPAPGTTCDLSDGHLRVGDVDVDLSAAQVWEPCPSWRWLRGRLPQIQGQLDELRSVGLQSAPDGSLLSLLPGAPQPGDGFEGSVLRSARQAGDALRAGWAGDESRTQKAALQLAGLGPGLTPAGDDFLAGAMLWAWLAHPAPWAFCQGLANAAALRTTALSAAVLRAAACGECSAAWHELLNQLAAAKSKVLLTKTVVRVLSYGHTSGADTLAGFLWMGTGLFSVLHGATDRRSGDPPPRSRSANSH